jgi:predicted transcriptional regulator
MNNIFDIKIDSKIKPKLPPPEQQLAEYEAIVENYAKLNPIKFEAKKEKLEERLAILRSKVKPKKVKEEVKKEIEEEVKEIAAVKKPKKLT